MEQRGAVGDGDAAAKQLLTSLHLSKIITQEFSDDLEEIIQDIKSLNTSQLIALEEHYLKTTPKQGKVVPRVATASEQERERAIEDLAFELLLERDYDFSCCHVKTVATGEIDSSGKGNSAMGKESRKRITKMDSFSQALAAIDDNSKKNSSVNDEAETKKLSDLGKNNKQGLQQMSLARAPDQSTIQEGDAMSSNRSSKDSSKVLLKSKSLQLKHPTEPQAVTLVELQTRMPPNKKQSKDSSLAQQCMPAAVITKAKRIEKQPIRSNSQDFVMPISNSIKIYDQRVEAEEIKERVEMQKMIDSIQEIRECSSEEEDEPDSISEDAESEESKGGEDDKSSTFSCPVAKDNEGNVTISEKTDSNKSSESEDDDKVEKKQVSAVVDAEDYK